MVTVTRWGVVNPTFPVNRMHPRLQIHPVKLRCLKFRIFRKRFAAHRFPENSHPLVTLIANMYHSLVATANFHFFNNQILKHLHGLVITCTQAPKRHKIWLIMTTWKTSVSSQSGIPRQTYWLYNVKGILQKRVSCTVVELKNIWSSNWIISKRTAAKIIQTIFETTTSYFLGIEEWIIFCLNRSAHITVFHLHPSTRQKTCKKATARDRAAFLRSRSNGGTSLLRLGKFFKNFHWGFCSFHHWEKNLFLFEWWGKKFHRNISQK